MHETYAKCSESFAKLNITSKSSQPLRIGFKYNIRKRHLSQKALATILRFTLKNIRVLIFLEAVELMQTSENVCIPMYEQVLVWVVIFTVTVHL